MIDNLLAKIENQVFVGQKAAESANHLEKLGFTCRDATKVSKWSKINPQKTTNCTKIISAISEATQIDIVIPEDKDGNVIDIIINKHDIKL